MGMSTLDKSGRELYTQDDEAWDVEMVDEEEDEVKDDEQLTILVRNSYLKHLKKCLTKNFEESSDKTSIPISQLEEFVPYLATQLEKKALRSCMRASIYQRLMVQLIDEIKLATKKNQIHPTFYNQRLRKKEVFVETGTQTEGSNEMVNMLSSAFGFSPTCPGNHEGIDSYEELLNILTLSPNLEVQSKMDQEEDSTSNLGDQFNSIHESPKQRMNLDERLQLLGLLCDDEDNVNNGAPINKHSSPPKETVDSFHEPVSSTPKSLKIEIPSNWTKEAIIQIERMESILRNKGPLKRAIIERRFKDLFGSDTIEMPAPQIDMIEARRRLAGHVVKALTQHYIDGHIGSRQVFKYLAKRVTDRLLKKHKDPTPAMAKKEIKICFALKPEILSTKDIDQLFSTIGS